MKVLLQSALATALLAPCAIANDADARPFYAKVSAGQTVNTDVSGFDLSDGAAYGASLGTAVGPIRLEGGVSRLSGEADLGFIAIDADALDYHLSGYLDLPVGVNASIFAGAGLDYIDAEASVFGSAFSADGQGWHWAVGGAYRLSERMIGEIQYRQIDADLDSDFGGVDLSVGELTIGVRLAL